MIVEPGDIAGLQIDQAVMMAAAPDLKPYATFAEIVSYDEVPILRNAEHAVNARHGDRRIDFAGVLMKLLGIGMIFRPIEHFADRLHAARLS